MRFYSSPRGPGRHSLVAFIAGVTTTLLLGGYYLFGPRGQENRRGVDRWLRRAKFEILERIENIENLTEDQYHKIVDEVSFRQGQLKGLSQSKIDQLRENLRHRWHEMRETAARARVKARNEMDEGESGIQEPMLGQSQSTTTESLKNKVPPTTY